MSSFIFFGCWNNVDCNKDDKTEYIIRDLVLKLIKKYINSNKKVVYLAGDNWYSNKVELYSEESAYYLLEVLKSGYDQIYDLKTEVHICAGNHDVKDDRERPEKKDKCMIKTQKKYIEELNRLHKTLSESQSSKPFFANASNSGDLDISLQDFSKLVLSATSSSRGLLENFHPSLEELSGYHGKDITPRDNNIINIYVDDIGVVEKYKYVMIIINTNRLNDGTYIENVIEELGKNYENKKKFVMGHIPFYYLKKNQINKNQELLDTLFLSMANNKCIYLCADAHQFSIMTISQGDAKLIQITMGTGGASPDINNETIDIKTISIDGYTIDYYLVNAYGYGIIFLYKNNINVIYKNIKSEQKDDEYYPVLTEYTCKIGTGTRDDSDYKFGKISIEKASENSIIDYDALKKNKTTLCDNIKYAIEKIKKKNDGNHVVKSEKEKDLYCFVKRKKTDKKSGNMSASSYAASTASLSQVDHSKSSAK